MKKEKFLSWFVGFTDAEGNFYTNKKCDTQTFSIHLSLRDKKNLYKLEEFLKFGKVYEDKKNNRVLFCVTKNNFLFNLLVPIFEKYPLLTRKFYQYEAWENLLIKRINKNKFERIIEPYKLTENNNNTIEEIIKLPYFNNWLIGFIEGEGSFMIIKDNKTLRPKFSICQKHDKIILDAIKQKLELKGKIIQEKKDFYRLTIRSKLELTNLIRFLEDLDLKFQGYKGEQYIIWCKNISNLPNYKICLNNKQTK